jgi:hypothetical protein
MIVVAKAPVIIIVEAPAITDIMLMLKLQL